MLNVDMWCWHNTSSVVFTRCWQLICDIDIIHLVLTMFKFVIDTMHSVVLTWCWQSICDADTIYVGVALYMMLTDDMWCWHNTSSVGFHDVDSRYVILIKHCLYMMLPVDMWCWHNTSSVVFTWCCQSNCDTIHVVLPLHDVDSWYVILTQLTQCIQCCPYMMLTVDMWCWHNTCSVAFTWCWQSICDVDTIHLALS